MKNLITLQLQDILVVAIFFGVLGCSSKRVPVKTTSVVDKKTATMSIVLNPYKNVIWEPSHQHKAALHVHTIQSDGYNSVDSVVRAFRNAGFDILSITDHDKMEPNAQFERGRIDWSTFDKIGTSFPKDPKPKNYPFNTTWPWTDFGAPSPGELGMVGIEGAEISYRHHMNSFFSSYGTGYTAADENEQLSAMQKKGGLAIFNHPSDPAPFSKGGRRSLEWYVEHFKKFPPDFLIGIDVSGEWGGTLALWDQLLARFMPDRPIWGFCTSDMHRLPKDLNQSPHTIFVLNELTDSAVRKGMESGQFYSTRSTKGGGGVYPTIERIDIDSVVGTITIHALNCDTIKWISAPESFEVVGDLNISNQPWPPGRIVHEGATLNYRKTPNIKNYVRAELLRTVNGHVYHTFTNPFGMSIQK